MPEIINCDWCDEELPLSEAHVDDGCYYCSDDCLTTASNARNTEGEEE